MALSSIVVFMAMMMCAFTVQAEVGTKGGSFDIAKIEDQSYFTQAKKEKPSQVKIKEKYQYYDIEGTTQAELKSQMKRKGTKWNDGKVYAALTSWDIRYDYDISYSNGSYQISSIKTSVDILFNFPKLASSAQLPDQVGTSWNSYLENLTKHEFGHRDIAIRIGEEIYETLATIGSNPDRSELEKEAQRLINVKLRNLKQDQIEYDHETCHGETQGAVLM